uniref:Uncharacterized protein n=1 Tax=Leersia perrieri TaxID=77586 RepID=A0A0D9V1F6_9ORYZ
MALQTFKSVPNANAAGIASLHDDLLAEILLRLQSGASLARAALASKRCLAVASAPGFLARFRARHRHASSPLLGIFVSHGYSGGLPVFYPAPAVRSDPDLGAAVRGGDFLLTRVGSVGEEEDLLQDCRNGLLLFRRGGRSVAVYDPFSRRCVSVRRPEEDGPFSDTYTDYLLPGRGGGGAASFRVVSVQRHGRMMRAVDYDSDTGQWSFHPWVESARRPLRGQAMHAAGLIFWKWDENSVMLLDTGAMEFSMLPLPVWLLVDSGGVRSWELEKEVPVSKVLDRHSRVRQVRTVATGFVLLSWDERYPQFVIDLKNLKVKAQFICSGEAYLFQMPWPPAVLVNTEFQPAYLALPSQSAEYVEPLQRIVTQDTVNHVNLGEERMDVVVNSEGQLDMLLGPHGPLDTQEVMATEVETIVATADLKLPMSAEAQKKTVVEIPEDQIRKGLEVPVQKRKNTRLEKRRGKWYGSVLHQAMEKKARYMGDVEQLKVQPAHLALPSQCAEYVETLHRIVTRNTANHVNLAVEKIDVVVNSEGAQLDLVLGPHGPLDTHEVMAAETETSVTIANLKLMSAEAQKQTVVEKPEIRKELEVSFLRRTRTRLEKRGAERYESVLHQAMKRKARYMGGMEQVSASPGRNNSRSGKPIVVGPRYGRYYQRRAVVNVHRLDKQ